LGKTTCHTTAYTGYEGGGAEVAGVVFGFGCDEEEDSSFGGGFNPGPRDETLVNCGDAVLASNTIFTLSKARFG
jgi:hypothetical protein